MKVGGKDRNMENISYQIYSSTPKFSAVKRGQLKPHKRPFITETLHAILVFIPGGRGMRFDIVYQRFLVRYLAFVEIKAKGTAAQSLPRSPPNPRSPPQPRYIPKIAVKEKVVSKIAGSLQNRFESL